jgi:N-acetyl-gamma-glutamyl-phosphate reductase common form
MTSKKRIGLVGARGFVGSELVSLLDADPTCELVFVTSKGAAGTALGRHTLQDLSPDDVAGAGVDGVVFGLPNGQSQPWLDAIGDRDVAVVDLSSDHRFDASWRYGLVEKSREALRGARRIANPGCYSTAAQLTLSPFQDVLECAHVFGVSGYSGAGATPSKKNDTALLADNLLPYDLIGHTQEKEMQHQSGADVRFLPHVAPFFRGITCTIAMDLSRALPADEARARLVERFQGERLVRVVDDEPQVRDVRGRHTVIIGGLKSAGRRLVAVAVIDNLLKGAATQALQNLHLALGVDELAGVPA